MASELSAREVEVLNLIDEGLTYRQVASRLFLSMQTVKTHLRRARIKQRAVTK